ncbi:MAG TPA: peptidylprolyl isomerase [Clostridia bacterium]|nr:peptidylprolyl isomerase [Clostridia bacterium]
MKFRSFCISLMLILCFSACSFNDVVCEIGQVKLRKSEYMELFNLYYTQYGTVYDLNNEENLHALQDIVLNTLIRAEVISQQAMLLGMGLTKEEEELIEQSPLKTQMKKSFLIQKLRSHLTADITVTEAEASEQFEKDSKLDFAKYKENIELFVNMQEAYDEAGGIPPLYVPSDFVRVKHILVSDESQALSLIERINAGESFEILMTEYGEDPGMKREPTMLLGYLMYSGTNFVPEFKQAGLELKDVGDITAPIKSSHGYHIIKLVEKLPKGSRKYEDIKETYMNGLLLRLKEQYYEEQVNTWMEETKITSHIEKIRSIRTPDSAK